MKTTNANLDITRLKAGHQIAVVTSIARARSWAARGRAETVVLGDEGEFWACTCKLAVRLANAGYEIAPVMMG